MSTRLNFTVGDTEPFSLALPGTEDITGFTIEMFAKPVFGGPTITLAGTILDGPNRSVQFAFGAADLSPGFYNAEVQITDSGSAIETIRDYRVRAFAQLD